MKKRNILSGYTKVSKEELVNVEKTLKDLIPLTTENGQAVAAIFDDDSYTYVPSCDVEWVLNEILTDDVSMAEIHNGEVTIKINKKISKNGREYFTMF